MLSKNRPEVLISMGATMITGCRASALNPMGSLDDHKYIVDDAENVRLAAQAHVPRRRFLARQPLSFPVGLAGIGGGELAKSLGNVNGGLPFSVFFKADAGIYRQKLGQLSLEDLGRWRDAGV